MPRISIIASPNGRVRTLLNESLPNHSFLTPIRTFRNSRIDLTEDLPEATQRALRDAGRWQPQVWWSEMLVSPTNEVLGPFDTKTQALKAEIEWLEANHLPEKPCLTTTA